MTMESNLAPTIYDQEPERRSPPLLEIGVLAWMRQNLFKTWIDTLVTVVAFLVGISVITAVITWAVRDANWYVIIYNLRLFFVGRYPVSEEWRVWAALLLFAFTGGAAWAAWARASRRAVIAAVVIVVASFIIPTVIVQTIPLPYAYFAAGNIPVTSGSSTQTPQPQVTFIGAAGETVMIRVAQGYETDDVALSGLNSFADDVTNLLRANAQTRLTNDQRAVEINAALAGDLLTAGQRQRLERELSRLTSLPPVTETYAVNQAPVDVRVLRASTFEPVGEASLTLNGGELIVTLPETGWYILEKLAADGAESVTVLQTRGLYPLFERNLIRSQQVDAAGNITAAAGRVNQYVRMSDGVTIEEVRPRIDGTDLPFNGIINNQLRGQSDAAGYARLFLAPLLQQISIPALLIGIAVTAGFGFSRLADRLAPHPILPRGTSRRNAAWLIVAAPIIAIVLIYGLGGNVLPVTETSLWGGLLLTLFLTITGITLSFPLGVLLALGRRSSLPIVSLICTVYIEFVRGVPLITVLFISQLLIPLVDPRLAEFPNVFRATIAVILFSAAYLAENVRGGLQSIPKGQVEAARALGLPGWRITWSITLPQALRAVIPALVGQFISLYKDTSLVAIVGLTDLTGIAENVYAQTEYIGLRREGLLFIAVIYFVVSFSMATLSRRIERSGAGVLRRARL
ncbi:MAG: amino acid ABC transporter permease [bacterium]|nr:amino acid ABC transporter permease [bacterium]